MPKRVTEIEKAMLYRDITALFEGALAVGGTVKGTIPNLDIMGIV